jgi:hypothetical protein
MALRDWTKTNDGENYITWRRNEKRTGWFNVFTLVAKTELGKWIVFLDAQDAGVRTLANPKSRREAILFAHNYMRLH